jgi:hypothetical protein
MRVPDRIAIITILLVWVFLDVCVVIIDRDDNNMYRYLTNQVWCLAVLAKLVLIAEMYKWNGEDTYEGVSQSGWISSLLFLVVGCAQFGVLGAFFLLVWLDSTMLDTMLAGQEHTIAEIIAWNHLRHVTVCFLHLAITWSLRHYLSSNSEANYDICCGWKLTYGVFSGCTVSIPLAIGLLHSAFFDDKKLYQFGSVQVGSKCQLAYLLFAFLSSVYFLFVPMRSSWLERQGHSPSAPDKITQEAVIKYIVSLAGRHPDTNDAPPGSLTLMVDPTVDPMKMFTRDYARQ